MIYKQSELLTKAKDRRKNQLAFLKEQNAGISVIINSLSNSVGHIAPTLQQFPELKQQFVWACNDLRWWCKLAGMREFAEELKAFPNNKHEDVLKTETSKELDNLPK